MRILIHGINFSPEVTGIGKYTGEMAEWLATQGHEVRVVTALPYYPQWSIADDYANAWSKQVPGSRAKGEGRRKQEAANRKPGDGRRDQDFGVREAAQESPDLCELCGENHDIAAKSSMLDRGPSAVTIYRCPLWVPNKPSGLKRVLHLASFALSSFPVMLSQIFWRPDVVWVVEPALFCAPQAWLVARLSGAKAWLHIQDYEVDAAFELNLLKGKLLRGLVAASERWLMRKFDRVSTISHQMVVLALGKGVLPERTVLFPNWVDLSGFMIHASDITRQKPVIRNQNAACINQYAGFHQYRNELGLSVDAVVALYSGNMGAKQGLEILAQVATLQAQVTASQEQGASINLEDSAALPACSLSRVPEVVYVFCGNGAGKAELVELCSGLSNVYFMDLQPMSRLSDLLEFADIHLLPQRADAADLVMPSKLTGMLASARPVVATAHAGTELAYVVEGCGLVVDPGNPDAFYRAINILAQDAVLRGRLGAAGRAYAEQNLEHDAVLGHFEAELKKMIA